MASEGSHSGPPHPHHRVATTLWENDPALNPETDALSEQNMAHYRDHNPANEDPKELRRKKNMRELERRENTPAANDYETVA